MIEHTTLNPNPGDVVFTIERNEKFQFIPMPPVKGYWIFPSSSPLYSIQFPVPQKPNWLHRKMMKLILGFDWKDKK